MDDLVLEIKSLDAGVLVNDCVISILLYADDIVLVSSSATGLQKQLDTLQSWCDLLRVNVDKTKIVHFRKETQQKTEFEFKFHSEKVYKVDSYRYLGIELSDTLDFSHTGNFLSSAGGKALGNLIFIHKNAHGLPSVYTKLYQSTVVAVMDYSCEIWGAKQFNK